MLLRLVEKPPHLRFESLKATVQSPLQSLGKTFLLLGVALGVLPLQDLQLSHVSIFFSHLRIPLLQMLLPLPLFYLQL
jgi:hypothetical protein